jgi:hypothetical protein
MNKLTLDDQKSKEKSNKEEDKDGMRKGRDMGWNRGWNMGYDRGDEKGYTSKEYEEKDKVNELVFFSFLRELVGNKTNEIPQVDETVCRWLNGWKEGYTRGYVKGWEYKKGEKKKTSDDYETFIVFVQETYIKLIKEEQNNKSSKKMTSKKLVHKIEKMWGEKQHEQDEINMKIKKKVMDGIALKKAKAIKKAEAKVIKKAEAKAIKKAEAKVIKKAEAKSVKKAIKKSFKKAFKKAVKIAVAKAIKKAETKAINEKEAEEKAYRKMHIKEEHVERKSYIEKTVIIVMKANSDSVFISAINSGLVNFRIQYID